MVQVTAAADENIGRAHLGRQWTGRPDHTTAYHRLFRRLLVGEFASSDICAQPGMPWGTLPPQVLQ